MPPNKNPFKILGLDPDIIRGLNDQEIDLLIKANYKTLMQIYHPDKNLKKAKTLTSKTAALNWARDELANKQIRESYQKSYTKRKKKSTIKDIEDRLISANKRALRTILKFIEYQHTFLKFKHPHTIYNLSSCEIELCDVLAQMEAPRSIAFDRKANFNYTLDVHEHMTVHSYKTPEGGILLGTIKKTNSIKSLLEQVHLDWIEDNRKRKPTQPLYIYKAETWSGEPTKINKHYPLGLLRYFMPLLRPYVEPKSYLLTLHDSKEGYYFKIAGEILEINIVGET